MTTQDLSLHATQAIIALAVVIWLIARQMRVKPVRERISILPLVLIALALQPPGPAEATAVGIALLGGSLILSAVMGVWRAATMRVWRDTQGRAWSKGTPLTAILWGVTVAIRIGLEFGVGSILGISPRPGGIWLALAVTLGIQRAFLLYRAKAIAMPGAGEYANPSSSGMPTSDDVTMRFR